jgi:peroxin-16
MQQWLQVYERFLLQNAGRISSIESTIRSFSYLITGQVHDVEIASETVFSTLQILGLYHDNVIAKASKSLLDTDATYRPSIHNRYANYYIKKNKAYRRIVIFLTLLRCTELLWEMVARRRKSERGRWLAVIAIEFMKAAARVGLLASTRARPLITPPVPEREIDPNRIQCDENGNITLLPVGHDPNAVDLSHLLPSVDDENAADSAWRMPRRGLDLPCNPVKGSVDDYLAERVLAIEDVRGPEYLMHQLSLKGIAAEALYIARPVVYALLAYHYRNRKRNWTPWVVGVLLEYSARKLEFLSYKETLPGGMRSLTKLEDQEHKSRATAFGWWLLRGAMYESVTRPVLAGMGNKLGRIPLGGQLFTAVVEDYLYLFDNYHFPSSSL